MDPLSTEFQQEVSPPEFTPNVQSNFRSLGGHLFDITVLILNRLHPCGQGHIIEQDMQLLKRDNLGKVIMSSTLEHSEALRVFTK
jgi:hypothetical protein